MNIEKLRENVEKIQATQEVYDSILTQEAQDQRELEYNRLKMKYAKDQMLRLTMEIKNQIKKFQDELQAEL